MGEIKARWSDRKYFGCVEMGLFQGVFWERIEAFWCEIWFLRLSLDLWKHWGDGSEGAKAKLWSFRR